MSESTGLTGAEEHKREKISTFVGAVASSLLVFRCLSFRFHFPPLLLSSYQAAMCPFHCTINLPALSLSVSWTHKDKTTEPKCTSKRVRERERAHSKTSQYSQVVISSALSADLMTATRAESNEYKVNNNAARRKEQEEEQSTSCMDVKREREKSEYTLTGGEATVHLCLVYKGKNWSRLWSTFACARNLTHIRVRVLTFLGSCLGEFSERAVRPANSQLNRKREREEEVFVTR